MLFNSVAFIIEFLPIVLLGWYLLQKLPSRYFAEAFLIGSSLWFYGYYNISYVWILVGSLIFNYLISLIFERVNKVLLRKCILTVAIGGNLGLLFYFKYFNFFLDNCNFLFHSDFQIEKIALPLGISFFTFQQLSFVIERYRKNVGPVNIIDYGCFITFFPQLIAGPIVLHSEFLPQLEERKNRRFSLDNFYDGICLFILGLAKKVLLADSLAVYVNAEYNNIPYIDAPTAWVVIIFYMLELYFDFSGYCNMACGIAKMFGFKLPENFDSPLMAISVKDFWRRWHITLSRFLTQYIYIPLGGNRKGLARKCINLMIVFLASGIWHGASWTFVIWGLMHGIAMVIESVFPKFRFPKDWMNRITTGIFVTLSFGIFRSESVSQAVILFRKLFTGGWNGMVIWSSSELQYSETYAIRKLLEMKTPQALIPFYMLCMVLLLIISILLIRGKKASEWIEAKKNKVGGIFILAVLFLWSFISLSQVSVFLYFNF